MYFVLIFIFCLGQNLLAKKISKQSTSPVCNETLFVENFVNKSRPVTNAWLNDFENACRENNTGSNEQTFEIIYVQNRMTKKYFFYADAQGLLEFTYPAHMYWGNILIIKDNNKTELKYHNFGKVKESSFSEYIPVVAGFDYEMKLYSIPNFVRTLTIELKAPSECGNAMLDNLTNKIVSQHMFEKCGSSPGFIEKSMIASEICKMYPENEKKRFEVLKNRVLMKRCKLDIKAEPPEKEKSQTLILTIMFVSSGVSLVIIITIVVMYLMRWRVTKVPEETSVPKRTNYGHLLHLKDIPRPQYEP